MQPFQCLSDINLSGKTLILRVDFNSPIDPNNGPILKSTKRIDDHINTTLIPILNGNNPPRNIVILAHQGRHGDLDCTTLRPHFEYCRTKLQSEQIKVFYIWEELTDKEVFELRENAIISKEILNRIARIRNRTILILENVRLSKNEKSTKSNAPEDFKENPLIKMLGEVKNKVIALDGFSVSHRPQPSVIGLANLGPIYAGPVVMREIVQLSKAIEDPEFPMVLVAGGAKIDDSLQSIEKFLSDGMANVVLTGGLVGLIFLLAQGYEINDATMKNIVKSCNCKKAIPLCKRLLSKYGESHIFVPIDVAYAPRQGFLEDRKTLNVHKLNKSQPKHEIGDIGIETIAQYNYELTKAKTIILNGPMGRYESLATSRGTREILRYIALASHDLGVHALIGGGDTGAALGELERDIVINVKECSSGKAFLQVLASRNIENLPGIRVLARKSSHKKK